MSPLFSFRACICCCYCHSLPRPNPSTSSSHQLQRTMASWLVQNSQGSARSAQSLTVCGIGPENSPKGVLSSDISFQKHFLALGPVSQRGFRELPPSWFIGITRSSIHENRFSYIERLRWVQRSHLYVL